MRLSYKAKRRAVLEFIDDLDVSLAGTLEVILKFPRGRFGDGRQSNSRRR